MRAYLQTLPPVKPTRRTARPAAPFGQGILPSRPHYRVPFTAADLAWAATAFVTANRVVGPDWDRLADEAAALDRYERGLCL